MQRNDMSVNLVYGTELLVRRSNSDHTVPYRNVPYRTWLGWPVDNPVGVNANSEPPSPLGGMEAKLTTTLPPCGLITQRLQAAS